VSPAAAIAPPANKPVLIKSRLFIGNPAFLGYKLNTATGRVLCKFLIEILRAINQIYKSRLQRSTDSPKTIRRQDWRRGTQDCALHFKLPPQVEQAARLAMPAVAPAERHNPEQYGSSNAIRRQDWRRGPQDCALHFKLPPSLPVSVSSVPSVVCFSCALLAAGHNLTQIFFPFLFNQLPTCPFFFS